MRRAEGLSCPKQRFLSGEILRWAGARHSDVSCLHPVECPGVIKLVILAQRAVKRINAVPLPILAILFILVMYSSHLSEYADVKSVAALSPYSDDFVDHDAGVWKHDKGRAPARARPGLFSSELSCLLEAGDVAYGAAGVV